MQHRNTNYGQSVSADRTETLPYRSTSSCNMLRLIHMYPSTDTNTTSDQWTYLHKNIIFLVIILILKQVLFRLMQKYLSPTINCLLCSISWYCFGGHSQFVSYLYMFASYSYSCTILQPYVAATVQMHSDTVLSSTGVLLTKTVIKNNRQ